MYIQTENTPNEMAVKFIIDGMCAKDEILEFEKESQNIPIFVSKMFEIEGIERVFITFEFITVTKNQEEEWHILKPQILEILFEAKLNGEAAASQNEEADLSNLDDISKEIIELIEERVKPAVAMDGGDITFVKFDKETGIVSLKLKGSCAGCPSSSITLQSGIKRMLQHYIPEVYDVAAV
jgi:Fe-S cluster biogenesis protein NfuA